MNSSAESREERLRVFEISMPRGDGIAMLEVDLPAAWARTHAAMAVLLTREDDDLGWHARLVGDDGEYLLGFPWHDDVDKMLLERDAESLPIDLSAGPWDDLEQGWWASAIAAGSWVYFAETDLDAFVDNVQDSANVTRKRPGVISVDGVDVRWNCVPRAAYDEAWNHAVARFQGTAEYEDGSTA